MPNEECWRFCSRTSTSQDDGVQNLAGNSQTFKGSGPRERCQTGERERERKRERRAPAVR